MGDPSTTIKIDERQLALLGLLARMPDHHEAIAQEIQRFLEPYIKRVEEPSVPQHAPQTVKQTRPNPFFPHTVPQPTKQPKESIDLKTANGIPLAVMQVYEDSVKVLPKQTYNVNTPPFSQFLLAKVFSAMAAKDRELAAVGTITPDEILTYRVIQDGEFLKEIAVRNWRDDKRLSQLKNSARWTLEKMYDKMRQQ